MRGARAAALEDGQREFGGREAGGHDPGYMPPMESAVDATYADAVRRALLGWYDADARALPWRVGPAARAAGVRPDPYRVWLSEIMLQQTTVPHATPYFLRFTERWPTVVALARAEDAEVMSAWAGLGYYARARNLLACARAVAAEHAGVLPDTEAGVRALPGVGAYTAAAVAAIAFDEATNVVDGNVERVVARLLAVETPLPRAKPELTRLAGGLVREDRPGDWAQALMDLGATVCRPRSPLCAACPLEALCGARATGAPETYPRREARRAKPRRHGVAYVLRRGEAVAVTRRPERGLLGGMAGLPTTEWREQPWDADEAVGAAPVQAAWSLAGTVEHVFTHFVLTLSVLVAEAETAPPKTRWSHTVEALPTVFRKVIATAASAASACPAPTPRPYPRPS